MFVALIHPVVSNTVMVVFVACKRINRIANILSTTTWSDTMKPSCIIGSMLYWAERHVALVMAVLLVMPAHIRNIMPHLSRCQANFHCLTQPPSIWKAYCGRCCSLLPHQSPPLAFLSLSSSMTAKPIIWLRVLFFLNINICAFKYIGEFLHYKVHRHSGLQRWPTSHAHYHAGQIHKHCDQVSSVHPLGRSSYTLNSSSGRHRSKIALTAPLKK